MLNFGTRVALLLSIMKTQSLLNYMLVMVCLSSCAPPPAPLYPKYNSGVTVSSNDSLNYMGTTPTSVQNSTNQGTPGNQKSAATDGVQGPSPASTNTTTQVPTCTMATPQLENQSGWYYVTASVTMTSSIPISYVIFYATNPNVYYPEAVGTASSAPYTVKFLANGIGYNNLVTLLASAVDANGREYTSICSTTFYIKPN